jgi:hypothetical protein
MQIYINNLDWPNHNIELWRYFPTAEEQKDPTLHPYLRDGRWRVFVHDVEASWAIWDGNDRRANEDTLHHILTGTGDRWNSGGSSAILHGLVSRDETRAQLANTFIDLIEGAFAPDNVICTLDGLIAQIENEHHFALHSNSIDPRNMWWPSPEGTASDRERIRRFALIRPEVMLHSVRQNLGYRENSRVPLNLTVGTGGSAMMNSRPIAPGQTVTANYYANTYIKITAQPESGYAVDEWWVDGVRVAGDYVVVDLYVDAFVSVSFRRVIDSLQ